MWYYNNLIIIKKPGLNVKGRLAEHDTRIQVKSGKSVNINKKML